MAATNVMDVLYASLSFTWFEAAFLLCFLLGFAFMRFDLVSPKTKKKAPEQETRSPLKRFDAKLKQAIESGAKAPQILAAWRQGCADAPTPPDFLKAVVQALVACEPDQVIEELVTHVRAHPETLCNVRTANISLDAIARAGSPKIMEELAQVFRQQLQIRPNLQTYEVMLGGYATAGATKRVAQICSEVSAHGLRLSPRGLSLAIKGFLKNGMIEPTIEKFEEMRQLGFELPSFAVTQLLRVACEANRSEEVYDRVKDMAPPTAEMAGVLLETCLKQQDFDFAKRVEKDAREGGVAFNFSMYDPLLKLYTVRGDPQVLVLFEEMKKANVRITEGLCAALLARCAEAKFLRFAGEIVKHARATTGMNLAMYSALMKVYAYCHMYGKACDLYDLIREDGLQPDAMMCGCLMKFAVECGRTDLSRQIAETAPCLEIQNYMSLIRAAGKDKDVDRAFKVLERLKASNVSTDAAVHNCVLDVCVLAGDMGRARTLVAEMRENGHLDVITYNTLIKGYCYASDLKTAKACFDDMAQDGIQPNDISFNCLLNACVHASGGNFREAWATIDRMRASGARVDHYTISIMMKAMKRANNPKDIVRALELLDESHIDVCSDEILLNSVLETCIRHQETRRLEGVIASFAKSKIRASVSTYGSLIKACSTLKNLPQCWAYWHRMQERGLEPTAVVLGCMLDALVCNRELEQAVELLDECKKTITPNAIMYSTIIKGFAATGQYTRAMATLRDIRSSGLKMTTAVYNTVIDAQARAGAMDEISEVLDTMKSDGIMPDAISWATIVKGHCVKGDLNKAFEVFRNTLKNCAPKDIEARCQASGRASTQDSMIYNNILDGCIRHSRFDLADTLLEEMEKFEVVPSNYTFGIFVKLYSRRRQVDKASELIQRLSKKFHVWPNNQVRTCLMCAFLNANSPARALEVFEEMRASPSGADGKAYSSLIGGLVRHKELTKATNLVQEAYGLKGTHRIPRGQFLETEVIERLMTSLGQRGQTESVAIPLLRQLQAAGIQVGGKLVSTVLGSCSSSNAKRDSRDMRSAGNKSRE